jgi:hypothetical protein
MVTYVVVWRGDEDDFFFTAHDMPEDWDPSNMTGKKWVEMSFDAEYGFETINPFVSENPPPYDLLQVFKTSDISWIDTN